ncbi:MAG: FGGY family carbohydrate kinase, partial [Gammaproteobacteria bacterium]
MTDGRLPGASRHLAIDQGGHASRVLAFDGAGTCLAHAEASIETRHPSAERVEHDPEALVASVEQSLSAVLDQLSPSRHGINAGLACQRSSSVCWDRLTGRALSPVISWQDRRNADWLDGFIGQQERIQRLTGLRLSPHYGAAKLAWCLDNLPEVREALDRERLCWGPLSAFLTARLTREHTFAVDTSIAGRTLLFEPRRGDWSKELVDLFRLPASVLPPCRPCRSDFGQLAVGGGEIPLGIVIGDQSAALFSHGQPTDGETRVNLGTGGFVQTATYTLPEQTNGLLAGIAWQGMNPPPLYVLEG